MLELQTKEGRGAEAKQLQNMLHWLQLIVASQHIHVPLPTNVAFDNRTLKMHQDRFDDALLDAVQTSKKRLAINRGLSVLQRIRNTCKQMYTKDMAEDCTYLEDLIESIEAAMLDGGNRVEVAPQTSQLGNATQSGGPPKLPGVPHQTGADSIGTNLPSETKHILMESTQFAIWLNPLVDASRSAYYKRVKRLFEAMGINNRQLQRYKCGKTYYYDILTMPYEHLDKRKMDDIETMKSGRPIILKRGDRELDIEYFRIMSGIAWPAKIIPELGVQWESYGN